jgi:hypothetical protein
MQAVTEVGPTRIDGLATTEFVGTISAAALFHVSAAHGAPSVAADYRIALFVTDDSRLVRVEAAFGGLTKITADLVSTKPMALVRRPPSTQTVAASEIPPEVLARLIQSP